MEKILIQPSRCTKCNKPIKITVPEIKAKLGYYKCPCGTINVMKIVHKYSSGAEYSDSRETFGEIEHKYNYFEDDEELKL